MSSKGECRTWKRETVSLLRETRAPCDKKRCQECKISVVPQQFLSCGDSEVFHRHHIQLLLISACYKPCLRWPVAGIVEERKKTKATSKELFNICSSEELWRCYSRWTWERVIVRIQHESAQFFRFTFPNTVCLLLSSSARPSVKKNWLPLSCGPAFAMATKPLRMKRSLEWNSSWKFGKDVASFKEAVCFIISCFLLMFDLISIKHYK